MKQWRTNCIDLSKKLRTTGDRESHDPIVFFSAVLHRLFLSLFLSFSLFPSLTFSTIAVSFRYFFTRYDTIAMGWSLGVFGSILWESSILESFLRTLFQWKDIFTLGTYLLAQTYRNSRIQKECQHLRKHRYIYFVFFHWRQGNVIESPSFVGKTRFHVYTRANQRVSSQDAVLKSELHGAS